MLSAASAIEESTFWGSIIKQKMPNDCPVRKGDCESAILMNIEHIMRRLPHSIAVSEEEANAFVCNAITVRNTVLSPVGIAAATREALSHRRMSVTELDMSEFVKSGGACHSLVLRL
ncbi:hypothetical protein TELCIR_21382 [Teladorsagia circumcincta]|uniref:Dimethylargininase n=1 Tax=Teladorsagia circumcincta TaxID=45464 RepID=A0A2G9TGW1_TELCI|nr:hypothetical protein TELCIR_21382 [Teladorsagia circumcincta]